MAGKTYTDNRDPKQADARVVIREFNGMAPNQSPHDLDPSLAAIQVNCYSIHPGELRCRQGLKLVNFTT